ncbi:GGDEF domain-containing protein [Ferrimonas marina]|uniref:diguanylate cyclase n=1 Tax=Ferrimonas marina TaxID=299255 RepID=A0A1M5S3J4_9GAMM|nr:GGDEF domain-containing protein [Ferrimonas marina]SHH33051.1 diguanylate cyclase (GGDEF) domain-containing protein [Ferrimonas marina]
MQSAADTNPWMSWLPEKALLHRRGQILSHNLGLGGLLEDANLLSSLGRCQSGERQLVVDRDGVLWCLSSQAVPEQEAMLTLMLPAAHQDLQQLIAHLPTALVVHRWFKPLFTNQAFADLFHFDSVSEVLELDSLRSIIGEEHWPMAQENYRTLMKHGRLDKIQVEEHHAVNGTRLQAQLVDFVLNWDGEPAVCTLVSNVSTQQAKIEQYKRMAFTDPLTGLGNRRRFFEHSEGFIQRSAAQGSSMMLLLLDVDHFKSINDQHGHPVGDEVLQHLGNRLVQCVDSEALLARIGGEEFALLMPVPAMSLLAERAERIKQEIGAEPFVSYHGLQLPITFSVGVTRWRPGEDSLPAIYRRADNALYRAKSMGRDRIECIY